MTQMFLIMQSYTLILQEDMPPGMLAAALRAGQIALPVQLEGPLLVHEQAGVVVASPCLEQPPRPRALSQREQQVMAGLRDGLTAKEMARKLCLSDRTVRQYIAQLKERFGAQTLAQLVALAGRL
ncbi:MAG TPA: LuxR C-terminal-related transcriptional regulator [Anaerolineaceae bacterium]|nr:LuxR C-terminal-related transcriptional regulator [Anaerolineaceae bacterium]HPN51538.1 LuxR C-terminal-related transcriptional regulator [Anaerolineaceae bacterium]